jgi:hypothetical protein
MTTPAVPHEDQPCVVCGARIGDHRLERRDPEVAAFELVVFGRTVLGELIHPAPRR